jgi:chemotaxis methyl-accepting protein methylase
VRETLAQVPETVPDNNAADPHMFKLGIYNKEQLVPSKLEGFLNSRKFIALDLYNSLEDLPQAQIDKIQERMLGRFSVRNGILKHTHAHRFDDFDELSVSAIAANFSAGQEIRVHDIAASDGRTSCALYDHLDSLYGERLDFLASDYAPYLYVLKRAQGTSRLIIDDQQHILQIIAPPFVFIVVRAESIKLYPLNYLIRRLVTALYARPLLEGYKAGCPDIERTRLELLCRECCAYISKKENFRFDRYDVLSGPTERVDIIRAMNVLNCTYFSEVQLRKSIENIAQSLSEGGLFITGSNIQQGSIVNGGIYKKTKNRLEMIDISGKGSPVDALISDFVSPQQ